MSPKKLTELGAVKDDFVARWHAGERPTLTEYLEAYPEFHDELVEFIVSFTQLFGTPLEAEECETDGAREAMRRGISAARASAKTIVQRLGEISLNQEEFERRLRFPFDALAEFHRDHVRAPIPFWMRVAAALQVTVEQAQRYLTPQQGALSHRAIRAPRTREVPFEELLIKVRDSGQLSQEDFEFWSAEASRK